jgi:hypothetical protein
MYSFDGVVKVGEINFGVTSTHELMLCLGEQNLMFRFRKEITLSGIEVDVRTEYLYAIRSECSSSAFHADFNIVVLETDKGERFSPIITEEEWENIVVSGGRRTQRILGNFVQGHGTRSLSLSVLIQEVVYTLDIQSINLGNLLTSDPKLEFCSSGFILIEETRVGITNTTDVFGFNPHITQKITLGFDRYGHFVSTPESTDVIKPFWLNREVSVSLIILTEKTDFRLTRDVYILGTNRHEVN